MASDQRKDFVLSEGDRIHCADYTYIITGAPIGYGGSAIVYPARRTDTNLLYAIKECFPREGSYHRPRGIIEPRDPGDRKSLPLLESLSRGVHMEQRIGQNIYNAGGPAQCIREILRPRAITVGGKTFHDVRGGCFAVLDRLDRDTLSFDDLLARIAASCSEEERRRTEGLPDIHTTACIMEELLSALEKIHTAADQDRPQVRGYYFGDLHGGNVYFTGSRLPGGTVGRVRLLDFGSARELDDRGLTQLLARKDIFCAPEIRAPEITRSEVFRLSRAADVFSAGCLMARCVMSRVQLQSYPDVLCTGANALIPDDCDRIGCTPELLGLVNRILDRATAFDSERRYPDASHMLRAIRALKEQSAPLRNQLGLRLSTLPKEDFLGRDRELTALDDALREGRNPIILHGFPGIGKTELAIEFGRKKSRRARVYFVRFAGTFLQTITGPIADAFSGYRKTHPGGTPKTQAEICREVLGLLGQCSADEILIIDHCDCPSFSFADLRTEEYHRLCSLPMHLLLTTGCDPDGEGHWQQVGPLDDQSLLRIMERHVSFPRERLLPLIGAAGRHTLMVDMLARSMQESPDALTPENLLKTLSVGSGIGTGRGPSGPLARLHGHFRSLFDVTGTSPDEAAVLCYATLLPAEGMDEALFRQALTEQARPRSAGLFRPACQPIREQTALHRLIRTGRLTVTDDRRIQIHPVLRELCRTDLAPDPVRCAAFLDRLWERHRSDPFDALRCAQMAHCFAAALVLPGLRDPHLASRAGQLYQKAGQADRGLEYAALALNIAQEMGFSRGDLAPFYRNLGAAWGAQGDYGQQFDCYHASLTYRLEVRQPDPLELAEAYSDLGICCDRRGQPRQNLDYQLLALEIRQRLLNPDHPDLAESYSRTGMALCRTGSAREGLDKQLKALRILERQPRPDPLALASIRTDLATICRSLGDMPGCLNHLLTALKLREKNLPAEHPTLAQAHHNLGVACCETNNWHASRDHYLKCLQIYRRTLPGSDPRLLRSCSDVAAAYRRLGDHETALEYYLQYLELQREILPEYHADLIGAYCRVAEAYGALGVSTAQMVYLDKAARSGDRESMRRLGIALIRTQTYREGCQWLQLAVEMNDSDAAYALGTFCLSNDGLPRDLNRAVRMLELAAARDHGQAHRHLGMLFLGVHPRVPVYPDIDSSRALKHLYRARELGIRGLDELIRSAEETLPL